MASLSTNEDAILVCPDDLTIHQQLNEHHQSHEARPDQQYGSLSGDEQRPSLSLPPLPEWNGPPQQSFPLNLPPTPSSPMLSSRMWTEDERLAFPCLGGPQDCWNLQLCPKHRQYPATPPELNCSHTSDQQTTAQDCRKKSVPAKSNAAGTEHEMRNTMKRHATDPESTATEESSIPRPPIHRTISRDSRASVSRGRVPHNLVERRYRDNLNHQIELLRLTLPSLRDAQPCTAADYEDASSPRMPPKAVIIQTAASYIQDMQSERARLLNANQALQEQVTRLQQLVRWDESNVVQYVNAMRLTAGL
ncbi:Putative myc-type, basic helix-loop-helix (bHLH) domain-containing protein [Septoria linicola]|uniref:Myc-type, basic helix-loop-helix (BHLH) domain-containing protein n=1 Tax=Septoria linicola TaxID=215465 RepID=A0A9Q9EE68_9PEZI|nr:putative myc-type, basic helix-loop-helix (bHLH) domain-containing protein [Septoria linicola]USW47565.1 Putative myc-type, basic helix-loop-helix (bHLH) domain-containing protein [Septoria linicola]